MAHRIAVGALLFEGNTLSPVVTGMSAFENNYLETGDDVVRKLSGSNTEVAGAIETLALHGAEVVPLLATHGGAGGRVAADTHRQLEALLLEALRAQSPVDGVYLALHGAFIAEGLDDMEGALLARVRAVVGDVPIAVSCDLHGHITPAMACNATFIIGYRHYPHDDTFDTGRRCAGLLLATLEDRARLVMRVRKAPMIVPAQRQRTKSDGPLGRLHARARARESTREVIALSYFPVQPWLDLAGVGFAAVAIADGDRDAADRAALDLAQAAWVRREEFLVPTVAPGEAIRAALATAGSPVVLADAADCVGGGASGDSAAVLTALLDHGGGARALMLIADPESARAAARAGVGGRFLARLGNKLDPAYGEPVAAEAEVLALGDGRFTYSGGILGGVEATMGPSALVRTGAVDVVVASHASYEYATEQFAALGADPWRYDIVVVKNPMNYQQAYAGAAAFHVLDTPGPTTPNLRAPRWQALSRPTFPLDDGFEPEFTGF